MSGEPGERAPSDVRPSVPGERVAWIDTARGIGIVLVVFGHTLNGVQAAGLMAPGGAQQAVYDAIYSFHIPLFFFIAGRSFHPREGMVRHRAQVLLYPYIVWSVLHGVLAILVLGATNEPVSAAMLPVRLVTDPIAQFWFLPALFGMAVIATMAEERLVWVAVGLFACMFWLLVFDHIGAIPRAICRNLGFFAAGTLSWRPRSLWWALGFAAVWLLRGWWTLAGWFLVPAFCGIFATIVLSERSESRVLTQLGRWSLVIYLGHVLIAAMTRIALVHVGMRDAATHVVLGTTMGIAGPALLACIREHGHGEWLFTPQWPAFRLRRFAWWWEPAG